MYMQRQQNYRQHWFKHFSNMVWATSQTVSDKCFLCSFSQNCWPHLARRSPSAVARCSNDNDASSPVTAPATSLLIVATSSGMTIYCQPSPWTLWTWQALFNRPLRWYPVQAPFDPRVPAHLRHHLLPIYIRRCFIISANCLLLFQWSCKNFVRTAL